MKEKLDEKDEIIRQIMRRLKSRHQIKAFHERLYGYAIWSDKIYENEEVSTLKQNTWKILRLFSLQELGWIKENVAPKPRRREEIEVKAKT